MAITLTVGTNTYVSRADADTFIRTYYLPTEAIFIWWNGLDDEKQTLYLYRSAKNIDSLPLVGFKSVSTQEMEFPRNDDTEVPDEVIEAQILNAYYVSQTVQDLPSSRNVKEYTIGDLTEKFWGNTASQPTGVSSEVLQILRNWLTGGFPIV